ncbi:hypothetical protein MGG_14678 [Pyricularia oryzae 70-15]|uniref:MOZ protein represents a chromatin-associated acetyltransferase n=3 Tax=Pyricularia oryzae TaxID=318829 RepID=G4NBT7_PYRO7|nr:uncharacterized protein MGG_14678 [Pyricularia oryzae 70-15]EHA48995.1 hypothetical protein MGG_14678 [Pyricularia oryzae 70-15]ELQ42542.1 hypothetical protein OOU_Y34scaffold00203g31 [Pyricularia oryzae Y34]KAI7926532.1 hypothetical protein M0657_003620 [Pyricularia oryzae]KAI7929381.1 hypothetical protein M9X92_001269 [Pyricularia oryzae]
MSTARLTFLYPHLFRAPRFGESATQAASHLTRRRAAREPWRPITCQQTANYARATSPKRATYVARHGKAVEPQPLTGDTKADASKSASKSDTQSKTSKSGRTKSVAPTEAIAAEGRQDAPAGSATEIPPVIELSAPIAPPPPPPGAEDIVGELKKARSSGPMETILHMGSPETMQTQHPHLKPAPYVHHFDTYSLVKRLEEGGYTQDQAITAMKAVRGLLAQNLGQAKDGLYSRSDMDNETYLFRAACSELSVELRNMRRINDEQIRQQRTHVQHEVDILTQSLNQELLTLNDNVKGMFNDRRMAVREEQKAAESAIQQINYKISVTLNSDAKSDIEGLRWVLIRRGVLGLILMALLSLGAIRYASYRSHEKKKRLRRQAEEAQKARMNDGKLDRSSAPDAAALLAAN